MSSVKIKVKVKVNIRVKVKVVECTGTVGWAEVSGLPCAGFLPFHSAV